MKVKIRPLEENDANISYRWRNDPELWIYTKFNFTGNVKLEDEVAWIRYVSRKENDYRFAIIADEKYVGNIYLTDVSNGIAQYHIFIGDKSAWGKGIASKATDLILEFARKTLKLIKIELEVHVNNISAKRVYEKKLFKNTETSDTNFEKMILIL